MNTGGPRIRKHAFNRPLARQTPKSGAAARRAVSLHLAEKQVSLTKFNPAKSKVLSFLRFMIFHVGQLDNFSVTSVLLGLTSLLTIIIPLIKPD